MIKSIDASDVARITSGQVIIDMALVVKEIVENSIDAGSDKIDITYNNYGVASVEISDNGHGIDKSDFEALCLRHHTSKMETFDDLMLVRTLGFRGEAMNSLCSVAKVKITTCNKESFPKATVLHFDSMGKLVSKKIVVSGKKGTTVTISDLFHEIPVRQKNLAKHSKREYSKSLSLLTCYLLAYPHIRFTVFNISGNTGKKTMTMGTQGGKSTIPDALVSVFGSNGAYGLVPLNLDSGNIEARFKLNMQCVPMSLHVRVVGYISESSFGLGRGSSDRQYLTVNKRPVTHKKLAKVINEVYKTFNTLQSPVFVVDVEVDTAFVDVNVTPDKRMVMMQSEDVVAETLREKLTEFYEARDNVVPKKQVVKMGKEKTEAASLERAHENRKGEEREEREDPEESEEVHEENKENEDNEEFLEENEDVVKENMNESEANVVIIEENEKEDEDENEEDNEDSNEAQIEGSLIHKGNMQNNADGDQIRGVDENDRISNVNANDVLAQESVGSDNGNYQNDFDLPAVTDAKTRADHTNHTVMNKGVSETMHEVNPNGYHIADECDGNIHTHHTKPPMTERLGEYASEAMRGRDPGHTLHACVHTDAATRDPVIGGNPHAVVNTHDSVNVHTHDLVNVSNNGSSHVHDDFYDLQDVADTLFVDVQDVPDDADSEDASPMYRMRIKISIPPLHVKRQQSLCGKTEVVAELHDLADTLKIRKSDFAEMEVVGQFNLGFIVVTHHGKLFIVDQHALDEIYNYERLMRTLVLRAQPLVVPRTLELLAVDEMIVLEHRLQLRTNGFIVSEDADARPGRRATLQAVPVLRNIVFDDTDLHELVHKLHDGSSTTVRCTKVDAMIALRACRGSIMVGQPLPSGIMRKVVQNLATLEHPWNCPHGRPTMRHLADLEGSVFVHDYSV